MASPKVTPGFEGVTGIKEIDVKLKAFEKMVEQSITRKAMRQATNVITKQAKENTNTIPYPKAAKKLKKNIRTRISTKGRGRWLTVGTSFLNTHKGADPPYWGMFFEYGTEERVVHNLKLTTGAIMKGVRVGSIPAFHFMSRAFLEKGDEAIDEFKTVLTSLVLEVKP